MNQDRPGGIAAAKAGPGVDGRSALRLAATGLRWLDALAAAAAALAAVAVADPPPLAGPQAMVLAAAVPAYLYAVTLLGGYDTRYLARLRVRLWTALSTWTVVCGVAGLALYALTGRQAAPLVPLVATALAWGLAGLLAGRIVVLFVVSNWRAEGRLRTSVAVLGEGAPFRHAAAAIAADPTGETLLLGAFSEHRAAIPDGLPAGLPCGDMEALEALIRAGGVDEVLLAFPDSAVDACRRAIERLRLLPVNVKLAPPPIAQELPPHGLSQLGGISVLHLLERPLGGMDVVWKVLEDRILGALLLLPALPVMLLAALAIRLEGPGPVLIRQQRFGFNSNPFWVYKLRSMRVGAENDPAAPQARRNDPRITRVGRFLRRTSIDELPQLFNVLGGSMSLVGPRPHAVAHDRYYAGLIDGYLARHRVKPGMTGWAQVNGLRGETDTPEKMAARVRYDLYYIDHWSLLFDLKILVLTPWVLLRDTNAY
ncbi:MAG: undecaprenyl-phosphate glucose phosphotransferase [Thalassobaculales bacterium]